MQRRAPAPRRKSGVAVILGGFVVGVCCVSVCLLGFSPGTLAPARISMTRISGHLEIPICFADVNPKEEG